MRLPETEGILQPTYSVYLHHFIRIMQTPKFVHKIFVREQNIESGSVLHAPNKTGWGSICHTLSGEQVTEFYQDLIQDDDDLEVIFEKQINVEPILKREGQQELVSETTLLSNDMLAVPAAAIKLPFIRCPQRFENHSVSYLNKAMIFAQENDFDNLSHLLDDNNVHVDAQDEYGWSLLMVASCAGAEETVKLLLERGASLQNSDSRHDTAMLLAIKKGHRSIVDLLQNTIHLNSSRHNSFEITSAARSTDKHNSSISNETSSELKMCDVCQRQIPDNLWIAHQTSIVHQFLLGPDTSKSYYGIPASNKGYQLLVGHGWDQDKGLGPNENGRKFPIKTRLKTDRHGLGATEESLRVTHFGPGDASAVKFTKKCRLEKSATISKKQRKRLLSKEKKQEACIRTALNEPDY